MLLAMLSNSGSHWSEERNRNLRPPIRVLTRIRPLPELCGSRRLNTRGPRTLSAACRMTLPLIILSSPAFKQCLRPACTAQSLAVSCNSALESELPPFQGHCLMSDAPSPLVPVLSPVSAMMLASRNSRQIFGTAPPDDRSQMSAASWHRPQPIRRKDQQGSGLADRLLQKDENIAKWKMGPIRIATWRILYAIRLPKK